METYRFEDFEKVFAKDLKIGDMLLDGPSDGPCDAIPVEDIHKTNDGVAYSYTFNEKPCISTVHPLYELYILKEEIQAPLS